MQIRHQRAAASSAGVDYPTFANEPGDANFGSLRAFAINTRDNWKRDQDILESKMMKTARQGVVANRFFAWRVLATNARRIGQKALNEAFANRFSAQDTSSGLSR